MKIKHGIIHFRSFLLDHISNKYIRNLVYGLISYQMMSYTFFGIFTALIDYFVYAILTVHGMNELFANIFSWIFAVLFSYITNRIWVFKSRIRNLKVIADEFIKFISARLSTLVMTEVIIFVAQITRFNTYISKIIAMTLTIIFNYVLSKLFIFNKEGLKK